MDWGRLVGDPSTMVGVVVSVVAIYLLTVASSRIAGARSLAALTTFDFVVNVAIGATVGSVAVTRTVSILDGVAAILMLFGLQLAFSYLRLRTRLRRLADNEPLLLMLHGEVLRKNLVRARVTEEDVRAALRSQNVHAYGQVDAVVLEATGSLSVLHGAGGAGGATRLDPRVLAGVRGYRIAEEAADAEDAGPDRSA